MVSAATVWARIAAGTVRDLARCEPIAARSYVAAKRQAARQAREAVRGTRGRARDRAAAYAAARRIEYRAALQALLDGAS